MSSDKKYPAFYYSAPALPPAEDNPFYDPFNDVPTLDDAAARPGDLFKRADGSSSLLEQSITPTDERVFDRPRAGKLNWSSSLFK